MAHPSDAPKTRIRRRSRGFQAAATLLADRVQKAAEGRGFAVTRLLTNWAEIAGPQLAPVTRPVRISHARNGLGSTLTLLTTGPMAPMVEMQLPRLRDRVNACYGYNAVSRITLTQTAATGFAEGQAEFTPAKKPRPQAPDPAIQAEAAKVAAPVADDALRAALEALAQNILTRRKLKEGQTP